MNLQDISDTSATNIGSLDCVGSETLKNIQLLVR